MVQRERLLFKYYFVLIIAIVTTSCNNKIKDDGVVPSSFVVSTAGIPNDTLLVTNPNVTLRNGVYYWQGKAYSGYLKEMYSAEKVKCIFSFLNGKQQGLSLVYFQNGKLKNSRNYKEGRSFGRHYGYWENGNQKFDFIYVNDRREGVQKQWYESGGRYSFLAFKNDREHGMQYAWRENGKPYINYEAKEGRRYGLQKSNLCYTLQNQKIKLSSK
ncbi:toxin-antitoxin system YwqK family antitoxin [Flavobacterium algicola]|uniref:toxin-antitoxin system YwqK family antitoxin n=1 Tax=Flavobacterium algicola TaxID=556529 RepID=UPI001EFDA71D|nr:hypothetical protein [Flavobacterium algicola]MCG9791685.1 hypothetical protein [Flavobacterium algicola]